MSNENYHTDPHNLTDRQGDATRPFHGAADQPPQETFAEEPASPDRSKPKPGIGLALGGGAARGWAHIGVLRAMDEAGIPISMIAGTSIGALVGGCYLAGMLDELEAFARSLKKSNILRFLDFSLLGGGLISGGKLAEHMKPYLGSTSIESLDRPFVSVATDIDTAHEIWLHDGPIIDAIRASYALPGVFHPVVLNDRRLVDGALVNPVPVSVCRAYEAEIVVAVNLNAETFGRGTVIRSSHYEVRPTNTQKPQPMEIAHDTTMITRLRQAKTVRERLGITGVMMQSFNIIQDRITRARLAGDPPDYTIRPKLYDIGLAEFHRADETIELGYEEGKRRIAQLVEQGDIVLAPVASNVA